MLEPLRHFALVAQHGTLTAAARHAHVTQPALTASIQRLEAQMGAKLLVRGPGGASLTAAGEALLPRARAALAAVEEGRRAVAEITGLAAGTVRLGAGATVCTYYLPRTIAKFRAARPGVRLHLREAPPDDLLDALEAGDLDLVILSRIGRVPGGAHLAREKWLDDELVLVGAPGVDPKTAPLVTFAHGQTTRTIVDRVFPEIPIAMELGSIAAVKGNTRAGVGIALVSRRAAQRDVAIGQLVEIPSDRTPIVRALYLVHRGRDRLPPAAAELLRMLRKR
ncbi:MAG TPA: LysR family transcriptional regulator [Labilithrix sp.]|jgi:DNA-binding transcriptional LysR family regulator